MFKRYTILVFVHRVLLHFDFVYSTLAKGFAKSSDSQAVGVAA
jgi:hypothetical protein